MNVWKLTAAKTLELGSEELQPQEGKRRVRVSKVYIAAGDAHLSAGIGKMKFPCVPGRYAVGIIADEGGSPMFPKGSRVLLHSYLPAADTGVETKSFSEDEYRILGRTEDGFLRDFVYVREDDMTPIPDAVNDEKALLIQYVALAQAVVESLDVKKGEHIAVIGAGILGIFISRLLIYRQAAPVLIDNRRDRLDFARSRGVYYTSLSDETLMGMVGTVTGGRLADGAVYVSNDGENDKELPVKVCAAGKHIAYCGVGDALPLDLGGVIKKQLTVHGVSDGTEHIETAINLIANKAVDLNAFRYNVMPAAKGPALFKEIAENPDRPVDEINILNLV